MLFFPRCPVLFKSGNQFALHPPLWGMLHAQWAWRKVKDSPVLRYHPLTHGLPKPWTRNRPRSSRLAYPMPQTYYSLCVSFLLPGISWVFRCNPPCCGSRGEGGNTITHQDMNIQSWSLLRSVQCIVLSAQSAPLQASSLCSCIGLGAGCNMRIRAMHSGGGSGGQHWQQWLPILLVADCQAKPSQEPDSWLLSVVQENCPQPPLFLPPWQATRRSNGPIPLPLPPLIDWHRGCQLNRCSTYFPARKLPKDWV